MYNIKSLRLNVRRGLYLCLQKSVTIREAAYSVEFSRVTPRSKGPQEFYEMVTENGEAEAKQFYATAEKEKQRIESRVKELDNIIRCLYEDRVRGRISVERYDAMAVGYETEQAELKQELASITKKMNEMDMRKVCIREFIEQAKAYVEMEMLTPELLRVFIRKIQIFEKTEKYSRTAGNPLIIHFTFQPHAYTDFIKMNFREELLEAEQAEIA